MKQAFRKTLLGTALTLILVLATHNELHARAVLVKTQSYGTAEGCIVLIETYQHRLFGINWYSSEEKHTIC